MRRRKLNTIRKFEVLEDRQMMTANVAYDSSQDTLLINGDDYKDVAHVRFEGSRVYADLVSTKSDGTTNHLLLDKKIDDVSRIVFNGFAGDDSLSVVVNLSSGTTLNNVLLEFHGGDNDDRCSARCTTV